MFFSVVSAFPTPHFRFFFFFNDPATTEIYTLSLHDALPIFRLSTRPSCTSNWSARTLLAILFFLTYGQAGPHFVRGFCFGRRSEEHTSGLQSRRDLVCRLLLEKKKKNQHNANEHITPLHHST